MAMKYLLGLLLFCTVVFTTSTRLQSLSAEKISQLLRSWDINDNFLSVFEDESYDGYALDVMTKEDIDAEFPDSSPIHRRALYSKIQDFKNLHRVSRRVSRNLKEDAKFGPKPASYFKDYHGVNLNQEKGWITFGENKDVKIYRGEKGALTIEAGAIDFVSAKVTVNGKPLAPAPAPAAPTTAATTTAAPTTAAPTTAAPTTASPTTATTTTTTTAGDPVKFGGASQYCSSGSDQGAVNRRSVATATTAGCRAACFARPSCTHYTSAQNPGDCLLYRGDCASGLAYNGATVVTYAIQRG